jgi:hypothetical protein
MESISSKESVIYLYVNFYMYVNVFVAKVDLQHIYNLNLSFSDRICNNTCFTKTS